MYVLELHPERNTFPLESMESSVERIEDVPTPRLALFDVDGRSIVLGRNPETNMRTQNLSRTVCEIFVHVGYMGLLHPPHCTMRMKLLRPDPFIPVRHNGTSLVLDDNDFVVLENGDRISLLGEQFEYVVELKHIFTSDENENYSNIRT